MRKQCIFMSLIAVFVLCFSFGVFAHEQGYTTSAGEAEDTNTYTIDEQIQSLMIRGNSPDKQALNPILMEDRLPLSGQWHYIGDDRMSIVPAVARIDVFTLRQILNRRRIACKNAVSHQHFCRYRTILLRLFRKRITRDDDIGDVSRH